jgi:outer membrane protein OmpA-like peptidoglycan-associated protein
MNTISRLAWPVAATACIAATGCGSHDPENKHTEVPACAKAALTSPSNTPTVAILTQAGTPIPSTGAPANALPTVLDGAEGMRVVVNGIADGANAPNLRINTILTGTANNRVMRKLNLDCKKKAVNEQVAAIRNARSKRGVDVVGALATLAQDAKSWQGPLNVVLFSSMRQSVGVDLNAASSLANPDASINTLTRGSRVFPCAGWRIYVVRSSNGTSTSDAGGETRLMGWWRRYFERCGGTLASWNTELPKFPITGSVAAPTYDQVPPIQVVHEPTKTVATIDSNVLFALNSATLKPAADAALRRELLVELPKAIGAIRIDGYTDSQGSDAVNEPLSKARAASIAEWIHGNAGLPVGRLKAVGHGAKDAIASNATAAGRAKNRRVVITMSLIRSN